MLSVVKRLLGDSNQREIKRMAPLVARINGLEAEYQALTNEQLRDKTTESRGSYLAVESLDSLLPEGFAAVREAGKRTLGQRHYDVQLIGGMALNSGKIAEMRTGEGKTLVATL